MKKFVSTCATFVLAVALAGCGGEPEHELYEDNVPLDQLPPAVLEAAKKQLPNVKFKDAWKEKVDGKDAYEVRGSEPTGKNRDVKISAEGKVLEVD
ncbi:MAG: hypothetical protein SFX72_17350 [Isosphaeraceae bacterium]|nr:hypothetical protein [Isosphaeraceae bacterium]